MHSLVEAPAHSLQFVSSVYLTQYFILLCDAMQVRYWRSKLCPSVGRVLCNKMNGPTAIVILQRVNPSSFRTPTITYLKLHLLTDRSCFFNPLLLCRYSVNSNHHTSSNSVMKTVADGNHCSSCTAVILCYC